MSDGKLPVVNYSNKLYVYSLKEGAFYFFIDAYITTSYYLRLKNDNSWAIGSASLQNINQKTTVLSSSSTNDEYPSAKCVYDNIENVMEVASGKTATYVCSYANNADLNSQDNEVDVSSIVDINNNTHNYTDLKIGDNIYITELDVPDRWVSNFRNAGVVQLFADGNFTGTINSWLGRSNATYSIANNVLTVSNPTASDYSTSMYKSNGGYQANHKYMIVYNAKGSSNIGIKLGFGLGGVNKTTQWTVNDQWVSYYYVTTLSNPNDGYIRLYFKFTSSSDSIQVKNCMVIDLTAIYGDGNEPTTYADFKDDFPNDYYPYNTDAGLKLTILSKLETAKVPVTDVQVNSTSVVSNSVANVIVPT